MLFSSWNVSFCTSHFIVISVQILTTGTSGYIFDLTASGIPPFYWKFYDWCQLTYQQSNHPKCLETENYFLERQTAVHRPPSPYGHVTFSGPPFWTFWALSYDWYPLCHFSENQMIPPKKFFRKPEVTNNDWSPNCLPFTSEAIKVDGS